MGQQATLCPSSHVLSVLVSVRQSQRIFSQMGCQPSPQEAQSDPVKVRASKKLNRLTRRRNMELGRMSLPTTWQALPDVGAAQNQGPFADACSNFKSVVYFGAVNLRSRDFVCSMCAKFDAATFETFLRKLLRHRSLETHDDCGRFYRGGNRRLEKEVSFLWSEDMNSGYAFLSNFTQAVFSPLPSRHTIVYGLSR